MLECLDAESANGLCPMCNPYGHTKGQQAIVAFLKAMVDPYRQPAVVPRHLPRHAAQIVRNTAVGRELALGWWSMPSLKQVLLEAKKKLEARGKTVDFPALLRMEPDSGTTNIRDTGLVHWKR